LTTRRANRPATRGDASDGTEPGNLSGKLAPEVYFSDRLPRTSASFEQQSPGGAYPDGTPMSARQFTETLYGKFPEFFKDETELRALWSSPDTRAKLLEELAEKGFGGDQMAELQRIIDAEKSDLFDVLAHVAFALAPLTREERAARARLEIQTHFDSKRQAFLNFVLAQYVKVGVHELDAEKLSPLLKLKYNNAIADAIADLGKPEEIGNVFTGFQKYLYLKAV
jgi:type I restriction enzyme, R subunit